MNPLEDDSRWTMWGDILERRLKPVDEILRQVLLDANLCITIDNRELYR